MSIALSLLYLGLRPMLACHLAAQRVIADLGVDKAGLALWISSKKLRRRAAA
jgi:hypothetical protein